MSRDSRYLCYGHRLSKGKNPSESTGSFVLRSNTCHHWVQIVENINQIPDKPNRFGVMYEYCRTSSTQQNTQTTRFFRQLTKEDAEAVMLEIFDEHAPHTSVDEKPFVPTHYHPLDPDLERAIDSSLLDQQDQEWKQLYYDINRSNDPQLFHYQIKGKGLHLVKSARGWRIPYTNSDTAHSLVRGIQWRFVQTFSGFETIILSHGILHPEYESGQNPGFAKVFYTWKIKDHLDRTIRRLNNTKLRDDIQAWHLESNGSITLNEWFIEFLNPNENGRLILDKLQQSGTKHTWKDGISLASVLRNLTAHGALSPTQTISQGLISIYLELTALIVQCSYAAALMTTPNDTN